MSYSGIPQKDHIALRGLEISAYCLERRSFINVNKELPCNLLTCMTCNFDKLSTKQQLRVLEGENIKRQVG